MLAACWLITLALPATRAQASLTPTGRGPG